MLGKLKNGEDLTIDHAAKRWREIGRAITSIRRRASCQGEGYDEEGDKEREGEG